MIHNQTFLLIIKILHAPVEEHLRFFILFTHMFTNGLHALTECIYVDYYRHLYYDDTLYILKSLVFSITHYNYISCVYRLHNF